MNGSIDETLVSPHKHHDRLKFSRASLSSISSLVKKGSGYSLTVAALFVGESIGPVASFDFQLKLI